jgi:hypothetical protein
MMATYRVTYVFGYATISVTVDAMTEEGAPDHAAAQIYEDLGFSELSSFLHGAQELIVEACDE